MHNDTAFPEAFRMAAERACSRADVEIREWWFDGNELRLTVACERGSIPSLQPDCATA